LLKIGRDKNERRIVVGKRLFFFKDRGDAV